MRPAIPLVHKSLPPGGPRHRRDPVGRGHKNAYPSAFFTRSGDIGR